MYYVVCVDQEDLVSTFASQDKNEAIRHFNFRCSHFDFFNSKRIEILDDDTVLFDYEE